MKFEREKEGELSKMSYGHTHSNWKIDKNYKIQATIVITAMDSIAGVLLTFPFVTEESQTHAYCVRKKPIEGRRNYSRSVTRYANESAKKKLRLF